MKVLLSSIRNHFRTIFDDTIVRRDASDDCATKFQLVEMLAREMTQPTNYLVQLQITNYNSNVPGRPLITRLCVLRDSGLGDQVASYQLCRAELLHLRAISGCERAKDFEKKRGTQQLAYRKLRSSSLSVVPSKTRWSAFISKIKDCNFFT